MTCTPMIFFAFLAAILAEHLENLQGMPLKEEVMLLHERF